jgi:hypothetical protein
VYGVVAHADAGCKPGDTLIFGLQTLHMSDPRPMPEGFRPRRAFNMRVVLREPDGSIKVNLKSDLGSYLRWQVRAANEKEKAAFPLITPRRVLLATPWPSLPPPRGPPSHHPVGTWQGYTVRKRINELLCQQAADGVSSEMGYLHNVGRYDFI